MAHDTSTVVRSCVLTNSAAEFIELRAQETLGAEVVSSGSSQYVPVRDQFMPKAELTSVDYHAESAAKLAQFEATLRNFAATIKERGFEGKLGIKLKNPQDYSMADVLSIAEKIQEKHRDADKVKSAMGRIRKCFRFAEDNHGQLKRLLKFVPNDTYGTVISGGFTIILGAVERAENLRTDIYEALGNIPLRLREVQDLAEVHYHSADLQRRADSVFVAIFTVLERIVSELSKNMAKRGVSLIFKGDRHAFDLTDAFRELEKQMKEFRIQAEICLQHRFGRMDHKMTRAMLAAESCEALAAKTGAGVEDVRTQFQIFRRRVEEGLEAQQASFTQSLLESRTTAEMEVASRERLLTNVFNMFYAFLAGSPSFDSRSGKLDMMQAMALQRQIAFGPDQEEVARNLAKRNKKLVAEWLEYLSSAHHAVRGDLKECMQSFGTFSLAEKHQVQWILTSDEIHAWLRASESTILLIESQTHPDGVLNPLSFISSFLVKALRKQNCLTVCCFAGLRANESMQEGHSGPAAMLASLLAQLLIAIRKRLKGIRVPRVPTLEGETESGNACDAARLKEAIENLVEELPDRTCVFVVLDSMIHLSGQDAKNNEAIEFVLGLARDSRLVFKTLVTGLFTAALVESVEHELLFVPDFADAGNQDTDLAFFEGDTFGSIESLND